MVSAARNAVAFPDARRRAALEREMARAGKALADLAATRAPELLADDAAWRTMTDSSERATAILAHFLAHTGVTDRPPRAEVREREPDERAWTEERIVVDPEMSDTPFVCWEMAQFVARKLHSARDIDADVHFVAIALGLGAFVGGPARAGGAERWVTGPGIPDDGELGFAMALRARGRGASEDEWVALARVLRPSVRGAFELAHAELYDLPDVPGTPLPLRRRWLLARLDELGAMGERAVLEPTPEHFPDRWHGDVASVRRVATRLLAHVGLGDREVVLELFGKQGRVAGDGEVHRGTAAWFARIDEERVFFGVRTDLLEQAETLVGTLAHEVTHAYRAVHALTVQDRDDEEERTDVTTVFLGFGVLTANASDRYEAGMYGPLTSRWTHSNAGYLDTEDFAWLLAALARTDPRGWRKRARHLGPRQRDAFDAAQAEMAPRARPRRRLDANLFWVALLGVPIALFALFFWARSHPVGDRCGAGEPCRFFLGQACIEGRCTIPCHEDAQCGARQECATFTIGGRTEHWCARRRGR